MSKYIIRVNCPSFLDVEVEAETDQEAIELAEHDFICPASSSGEFCEILHKEDKDALTTNQNKEKPL